jgi:hypothetical protein
MKNFRACKIHLLGCRDCPEWFKVTSGWGKIVDKWSGEF